MPRARSRASARPYPDAAYWDCEGECVVCEKTSWSASWGLQTLVVCDACGDNGIHVGCHERVSDERWTREQVASPSFLWHCGPACARAAAAMADATGIRRPLDATGLRSFEVARYEPRIRSSVASVEAAIRIFHEAFEPLRLDDGRDLIELICRGYEGPSDLVASGDGSDDSDESTLDYGGFRVALLRQGNAVVSAAALRCFGPRFAEVPFAATRREYRREGHFRRLLRELERLLATAGVRWLTLPAVPAAAGIWRDSFGFAQADDDVAKVIGERIFMPDEDDVIILVKEVHAGESDDGEARGSAERKRAGTLANSGHGQGGQGGGGGATPAALASGVRRERALREPPAALLPAKKKRRLRKTVRIEPSRSAQEEKEEEEEEEEEKDDGAEDEAASQERRQASLSSDSGEETDEDVWAAKRREREELARTREAEKSREAEARKRERETKEEAKRMEREEREEAKKREREDREEAKRREREEREAAKKREREEKEEAKKRAVRDREALREKAQQEKEEARRELARAREEDRERKHRQRDLLRGREDQGANATAGAGCPHRGEDPDFEPDEEEEEEEDEDDVIGAEDEEGDEARLAQEEAKTLLESSQGGARQNDKNHAASGAVERAVMDEAVQSKGNDLADAEVDAKAGAALSAPPAPAPPSAGAGRRRVARRPPRPPAPPAGTRCALCDASESPHWTLVPAAELEGKGAKESGEKDAAHGKKGEEKGAEGGARVVEKNAPLKMETEHGEAMSAASSLVKPNAPGLLSTPSLAPSDVPSATPLSAQTALSPSPSSLPFQPPPSERWVCLACVSRQFPALLRLPGGGPRRRRSKAAKVAAKAAKAEARAARTAAAKAREEKRKQELTAARAQVLAAFARLNVGTAAGCVVPCQAASVAALSMATAFVRAAAEARARARAMRIPEE